MVEDQQPQSLTTTATQSAVSASPQGLPPLLKDCVQLATPFVLLFITVYLSVRTAKRAKAQTKEAEERANKRTEEYARESRQREHRDRVLTALFQIAEHSQELFYICEQARAKKLGIIATDRMIGVWGEGDQVGLRKRMTANEEAADQLKKLNEHRTRVATLMNVDAMRIASVLGEGSALPLVAAIQEQIRITDVSDAEGALVPTVEKFQAVSAAVRAIAKPLMNP